MKQNEVDMNDKLRKLKRKYEQQINEQLCCICMINKKLALFLPCNHVCCCMDCAEEIDICPLCRTAISDTKKVYL